MYGRTHTETQQRDTKCIVASEIRPENPAEMKMYRALQSVIANGENENVNRCIANQFTPFNSRYHTPDCMHNIYMPTKEAARKKLTYSVKREVLLNYWQRRVLSQAWFYILRINWNCAELSFAHSLPLLFHMYTFCLHPFKFAFSLYELVFCLCSYSGIN